MCRTWRAARLPPTTPTSCTQVCVCLFVGLRVVLGVQKCGVWCVSCTSVVWCVVCGRLWFVLLAPGSQHVCVSVCGRVYLDGVDGVCVDSVRVCVSVCVCVCGRCVYACVDDVSSLL
jgi:hypothetical protein